MNWPIHQNKVFLGRNAAKCKLKASPMNIKAKCMDTLCTVIRDWQMKL